MDCRAGDDVGRASARVGRGVWAGGREEAGSAGGVGAGRFGLTARSSTASLKGEAVRARSPHQSVNRNRERV